MNDPKARTWAEISLGSIKRNYNEMRKALPPGCLFAAVVKADAYGHGAVRVASLSEESGAEYIAVSCYAEARELREAGIKSRILIFGISPPEIAELPAEADIVQTVGDLETARQMSNILQKTKNKLKVHIKTDSGMGRLGFMTESEKDRAALIELISLPGLEFEGVYTHFAVSEQPEDDFTRLQYERFMRSALRLEKDTGHKFKLKHCANSGVVVNCREFAADMVRPGIALYGIYPGPDKGDIELRPAMRLKTRIMSTSVHKAGDSISYGRTYIASKPIKTAVIPIGYADGLHRVLSGKAEFLVRGRRVRQIGRICMDMCMIDVTDIPGCTIGDVVTVIGEDGAETIRAEDLAEAAGTIAYEIVCAVSKRVPRIYTD
ncbi:MAG: alanine racemase [Oscillospiraceae bacterium]|nr:alanine racemase [Oscillospiraceae bacterium]